MSITTTDLLQVMMQQQDQVEELRGEVEVLLRSQALLEDRYRQDTRVLREEVDGLRQRVGYIVSREDLGCRASCPSNRSGCRQVSPVRTTCSP